LSYAGGIRIDTHTLALEGIPVNEVKGARSAFWDRGMEMDPWQGTRQVSRRSLAECLLKDLLSGSEQMREVCPQPSRDVIPKLPGQCPSSAWVNSQPMTFARKLDPSSPASMTFFSCSKSYCICSKFYCISASCQ